MNESQAGNGVGRTAAAIAYAREQQDAFLEEFKALLAMPSVSTLPEHKEDVRATATWLAARLNELRFEQVALHETAGHPVVYGEWLHAPDKPTVLVYGHYDVQPVDPIDEWDSDPFTGTIAGDYIIARGASDMKGQLLAHLQALRSLAQAGDYPVNLKILFEGEEEIGSPNLPAFIEAHRDMLACDFVLNCDGGIHGPGEPAITYSLRGLAYFELELRSAAKDMHSGLFGGSVANPIHVLSELIAGMHDAEGRVTLPGFYDKVRDLDAEERELLAQAPYSDTEWLRISGAKKLHGEAGYNTIERIGARPALDVNGIWGGFTGAGSKTVLPAKATAKLSARLVADQQEGDVKGQLAAYLNAHCPDAVTWKLTEHVHGPGAIMNRKSPYMDAARRALSAAFGKEPFFKREGGSVPIVGMMQRQLGVDSIMLGFELADDGIHGPNERQHLPNYFKGIETYIHFLMDLERVAASSAVGK